MRNFSFALIVALSLFVPSCDSLGFRRKTYNRQKKMIEVVDASAGKGECPNDEYSNSGVVASPNFPQNYGNNEDCSYIMTAPLGLVIQITFTTFSTEACCDFLYIYDGPSPVVSPQIAKLSGTHLTKQTFSSTARWLSMQFTSDASVTMGGFQANFTSTSTAIPCNRDVVVAIDGHSTLGTQANFQQEINFAANILTSNWTVNSQALQAGATWYARDESVEWNVDVAQTQRALAQQFLGFQNNPIAGQDLDSMKVAFELVMGVIDTDFPFKQGFRMGVQRVMVMFLSFPPNDSTDLLEAKVFSDKVKSQGTKVILVGLNRNVNMTQLIPLSSGPNYVFGVNDVSQLNTALANNINVALCRMN